jgi:hypothetical protein
MQQIAFAVQRGKLVRYLEVRALVMGCFVLGWVMLRLGYAKAYRKWADGVEYRLDGDAICVSGCFAPWGIVLRRYEQRIPLAKITDVILIQGPILDRMGLWALDIQTSGTGYRFPEARLLALEDPHAVRDQIQEAMARVHSSN